MGFKVKKDKKMFSVNNFKRNMSAVASAGKNMAKGFREYSEQAEKRSTEKIERQARRTEQELRLMKAKDRLYDYKKKRNTGGLF